MDSLDKKKSLEEELVFKVECKLYNTAEDIQVIIEDYGMDNIEGLGRLHDMGMDPEGVQALKLLWGLT